MNTQRAHLSREETFDRLNLAGAPRGEFQRRALVRGQRRDVVDRAPHEVQDPLKDRVLNGGNEKKKKDIKTRALFGDGWNSRQRDTPLSRVQQREREREALRTCGPVACENRRRNASRIPVARGALSRTIEEKKLNIS